MKKLFCYVALISIFGISELRAQNQVPAYPCVDNKTSEENLSIVRASLGIATSATTIAIKAAAAAGVVPKEGADLGLEVIETVITPTVNLILSGFTNHTMGMPTPISINWNTLNLSKSYSFKGRDGDIIEITCVPGSGQIVFSQVNTWWKGFVAFQKDDTNKYIEMACLQDDFKENDGWLMTKELTDRFYFTFSKAKTFGVHTNMYMIYNMGSINLNYDYSFKWVKD